MALSFGICNLYLFLYGICVFIFYFHCHISTVHVRLIRVLLKINQSINQYVYGMNVNSNKFTSNSMLKSIHFGLFIPYVGPMTNSLFNILLLLRSR